MRVALAFLKRDFLITASYRTAFAMQLIAIFIGVPMFYFMGRLVPPSAAGYLDRYGGSYFEFLLIGAAFMDYLAVSLRTFNDSVRESQLMGTLEIMLLSPTKIWQVLIYSALWIYLFTTVRFVLYLVAGAIFGADFSRANPVAAMLVLTLTVPAFASMGILMASITMVIKKSEQMTVAVSTLSLALGGVIFPLSFMPTWMQRIGQLMPVTHALEGMRMALFGNVKIADLRTQLAVLLVFAAVLFPISLVSFYMAVWSTKRSGSLAQY